MSKTLAKLLNQPEPDIKSVVEQLETLSGYPSQDVRLIADIRFKSRQKIAELDLDPDDTTAHELYHALLTRYQTDALRLDDAIGAGAKFGPARRSKLAVELTESLLSSQEVWALKPSVSKKLLQKHPPKKIMKLLNYRSITSLLKREPVTEILLAASVLESAAWQRSLARAAGQLATTNWVWQRLKIARLPSRRFDSVAESTLAVSSRFAGAAGLWPSRSLNQVPVLTMCLLLISVAETLGLKPSSQTIANLHPRLVWWSDNSYLIVQVDDEPISFNIRDLAFSHLRLADHPQRSLEWGRQSLWSELMRRYQVDDPADEPNLQLGLVRNASLPKIIMDHYQG